MTCLIATTWARVGELLRFRDTGAAVRIDKHRMQHPLHEGARRSTGLPRGQDADYRFPPEDDGGGLHVLEFADRWEVHLDAVHPDTNLIEHLRRDAPFLYCVATAAVGALLAQALGARRDSWIRGGAVGLGYGALSLPPEPRPRGGKSPGKQALRFRRGRDAGTWQGIACRAWHDVRRYV